MRSALFLIQTENGLQCKNTARFVSYRDFTQGLIFFSTCLIFCSIIFQVVGFSSLEAREKISRKQIYRIPSI